MKWIKELTKITLMAIALVAATTPTTRAQGVDVMDVGCPDEFDWLNWPSTCSYAQQNGGEVAKPSQGLNLFMNNCDPMMNNCNPIFFDNPTSNQQFGHTFNLHPYGTIESARLEIHLKALNSMSDNDTITLGFVDEAGVFDPNNQWTVLIGTYTIPPFITIPGLLPDPWLTGTTTDPINSPFPLDLANLPIPFSPSNNSSDLLSMLNEKRFLDILITDNTAVDYIVLEIHTRPQSVPESSSVLGLMGLTAFGSLLRLSKRGKVRS